MICWSTVVPPRKDNAPPPKGRKGHLRGTTLVPTSAGAARIAARATAHLGDLCGPVSGATGRIVGGALRGGFGGLLRRRLAPGGRRSLAQGLLLRSPSQRRLPATVPCAPAGCKRTLGVPLSWDTAGRPCDASADSGGRNRSCARSH